MLAVLAAEPQESMDQDSTAEECLEFLGDMLWNPFALDLCHGLEGAEVARDRLVEDSLLWPARFIFSAQFFEAELGPCV